VRRREKCVEGMQTRAGGRLVREGGWCGRAVGAEVLSKVQRCNTCLASASILVSSRYSAHTATSTMRSFYTWTISAMLLLPLSISTIRPIPPA
jgi:hypothetical protein